MGQFHRLKSALSTVAFQSKPLKALTCPHCDRFLMLARVVPVNRAADWRNIAHYTN
jgi:hypothetical protein